MLEFLLEMRIFFIFLICSLIADCAFSASNNIDFIDAVIDIETYDVYNNTIVSSDSVLIINSINVQKSLYFYNNGVIDGDFYVCEKCNFVIKNSGEFSGFVNLGDNSSVIQIIESSDDMNKITALGGTFIVKFDLREKLKMSDILNIAANSDKIIINNSFIYMDIASPVHLDDPVLLKNNLRLAASNADLSINGNELYDEPLVLELMGEIVIELNKARKMDGSIILANVSGNARIKIIGSGIDKLYRAGAVIKNNNLYLEINRETDYKKVVGQNMGSYINDLKYVDSTKNILGFIDGAQSMSELDSIISRSVLLNPINLLRPIRLFHNFNNNAYGFKEELFINATPSYLISKELSLYAGKVSVSNSIKNWRFLLSGHMGSFENVDYLNQFSGEFYGLGTSLMYKDNSFWAHLDVNYSVSMFNIHHVYDGQNHVDNPKGNYFSSLFKSGLIFNNKSFYFSPFINFGIEKEDILHQSETSLLTGVGGFVGIKKENYGIVSDYQAFLNLQTNGMQTAGIKASYWSVADSAGVDLQYSISKDEIDIAHSFSAKLNVSF